MNEPPFTELPAALVQEVLNRTEEISQSLLSSFEKIETQRKKWREQITREGLLHKDSDLIPVPHPTCAGVDGAFAIERLLAIDLVAVGAVAVEGLTPPSEKRYWPEPYHHVYVNTENHAAETASILRGLMIGMEMTLAQNAPHEIVFLDGSLATPTIFFNQAISKIEDVPTLQASLELQDNICTYLESYKHILTAQRSDHYWVGVPKYTTKREIGVRLNWPPSYDDRGLLSLILEAGEYTHPLPLMKPNSPWHINTQPINAPQRDAAEKLAQEVTSLLNSIHIIYYRPYHWLPALRLEVAKSIAQNPARLSAVLTGIKDQCKAPAILEPFPLYMADRMIKHLAKAVPTFRQIASQRLAENFNGDLSEVFLSLHGYRTESGA